MAASGFASALAPYSKELIALLTPLLGGVVTRLIQPKAKLFHSIRHSFTYIIQEPLKDPNGNVIKPTQTVQVASVSVSNTGRSPARQVELVFNWRPQHFNVWPLRHFTPLDHQDGRFSLLLDSLAPSEAFGVSLLAVNIDLPNLCNVRSEQVESKQRAMVPQVVQPSWVIRLAGVLMFLGAVTAVYLLLVVLEWAIR